MQIKRKLLIVEDEQSEIDNASHLLAALKVNFRAVSTLADAFHAIANEAFDYLLTDLHIETKAGFDRPDGLKVIARAREQQPNIIIVANSSDPRADIWAEALAAGAQQFIRKPLSKADELIIAFSLAKERKLLTENLHRPQKVEGRWAEYSDDYPDGIVIDKALIKKAKGLARHKVAATVIIGETGTGKEEVAKLIHRYRCKAEGQVPFVAINCSTITGNLAESILFGHRKGAFTGADQTTQGYVAEADGGILFLDEIHNLDIVVQQKLLRVLNDGTYNRLGETKIYRSEFQLIAASTKDLDEEVDCGKFLIDLRNRIMGIDVHLLPLRDRIEDIPALTALYFSKRDIDIGEELFHQLNELLKTFYWRGNIRQLFKSLESWVLYCEFDEIPLSIGNFPVFKGMMAPGFQNAFVSASIKTESMGLENELVQMKTLDVDSDYEESMALFDKILLKKAIERHASITDCCRAINITRSTLDARRRKYGLI